MTTPGGFDHEREAALLSAYADGEIPPERAAAVEAHLAACSACRDELAALRRFDLVMGSLRLREAPPEAWEAFRDRLGERRGRRLGWVLLAAGSAVTGLWAAAVGVVALLGAGRLPWWVKAGVLTAAAGGLILIGSAVRERLHARARTRYKDVVR